MSCFQGLDGSVRHRFSVAGAAFIFVLGLVLSFGGLAFAMPPSWMQIGGAIAGEAAADLSGAAVAVSADGSRVAVGAEGNAGSGSTAGHVRVFDLVGDLWVQAGGLIDGEAANDFSGGSVALSTDGSRVAIGARFNDGSGSNAGHVRVFDLVGASWVQVGGDIDGEAAADQSGGSVSLSADGSRVAVGASANGGSGQNAGHVRVFDLVGASWVQVGGDIDGEAAGDQSGGSVSLSADGSRVAVGAAFNSGTGQNAGHVRVFDLVGASWVQVGAEIDAEAQGDRAGWSVSMAADGLRVAVGAIANDGSGITAGHVRVFDLVGASWVQVGGDIDGEAAGDQSGGSVSLSADGLRVAVGAAFNSGSGSNAGQVRAFDLIGASWVQVGGDIDGAATNDVAGWAVSLSADGSLLAAGSPGSADAGANSGHVRVFELAPPALCDGKVVTIDMNLGALGVGTAGDDVILGTPGDDVIDAGAGNDTVCAGDGDDVVVGGSGNDTMFGEAGRDIMRGNAGADSITGGAGNDRLLGGIDGDTLTGGLGNDYLGGFGGDDVIRGGEGNDTIFGGFGADIIDGDVGNDVIRGLIGDDIIRGGAGDDVLDGDRGNDLILGGAGNDTIGGGNANDQLFGEAGNDVVNGGKADDNLSGGAGTDTCAGNKAIVGDTTDGTCETVFGIP